MVDGQLGNVPCSGKELYIYIYEGLKRYLIMDGWDEGWTSGLLVSWPASARLGWLFG